MSQGVYYFGKQGIDRVISNKYFSGALQVRAGRRDARTGMVIYDIIDFFSLVFMSN